MSNQLQITGGAKVRSLEGVITGTSGVLSSVPLGGANGVATLDSGGKVPVSQLPSSVVTYLGTWDASTNTPTLTNGTGDAGDMYICNVAGTVNFGAGPITFAVGDWVLYGSGTWQKSNGQNGTVTSVAVTESGNALTITGSPITTAGTINIGFAGTSAQYVNGAGDLTTFPSLTGYVPYTGATQDVDLDTHVLNAQALHVKGTAGAGHLGLKHQSAAATGSTNESLIYANVDGDLAWQNDNLYLTTLSTHANTANRVYTFPDLTGTMAMLEGTQTFTGDKTFNGGVDFNNALNINNTFNLRNNLVGSTLYTNFSILKSGSLETLSLLFSTAFSSKLVFNDAANYTYTYPSASGNLVLGSGSADSVAYWNSASGLTYDSTFYYSSSNKRLGVNTNTPNATIGANCGTDSGYGLLVKNADNNYNGLGIAITSNYGNVIATEKLGTASAKNLTLINQVGYLSLTEAGNLGLNILNPTPSPSGVGSTGFDVFGGSNAASIGFHNTASGVGNTNGAYIYLTNTLGFTLRNLEGGITSSSLGDFSVITNSTENFRVNASTGSLWQSNITSAVLKANSSNVIVAAVAGTDYQAPITLTTTGSSGAATFSSNTLNVPNYTLSGLGGVPTSRTLTINGTAYDLSADRTWSVGTLTGGGADGRVAFWNGASNVVSDSLFVWDDTNNRLGIGLVNPQRALEIYSTSPDTHLRLSGAAPSVSMGEAITGSIYQAKFGLATANNQFVTGSVAGDFVINNQTGSTIWAYNSTEKMRLDTNGNLGVGGIANSSYRLHVFGTGTMLGIETTAASNVYLRMLQAGTVVGGMYYNNSDSTLRINNNNGGLRFDTSTVNGALTIASTGAATFSSSVAIGGAGMGLTGINMPNQNYLAWYASGGSGAQNVAIRGNGNALELSSGGGLTMTLDTNQRVGIGTSNPSYQLDLGGGTTVNQRLRLQRGTDDANQYGIYGWNQINLYRANVSISSAQTDFSINQVGSDGSRTPFYISSGGNVGIGTSSPNFNDFSTNTLGLQISNGSVSNYAGLKLTGNPAYMTGSLVIASGGGTHYFYGFGSNSMVFATNDTERMRITSGGQFIVGDTSMGYANSVGYVAGFKSAYANQSFISIARSTQSLGSGGMIIGLDSGTSYVWNRENIAMAFGTNDTERIRITSGGNVVIGDTSAINGAALGLKGTVATQQPLSIWNTGTGASIWFIEFETGSTITARGSITYNGTNVLYNATSDYRLKQDLKDFDGLDKVSKIKVYDFLWKDTEIRDNGVIAHELAEVLPLAVTGEKDGEKMQGVDYSKIVPILVKAIQEQQAQIEELKALINK